MEKRSFGELRTLLLHQLAKGKKTINTLAKEAIINWKTVDNHLVFLIGKGLVVEVLTSPYARIFDITEKGKELVEQQKKGILKRIHIKKRRGKKKR